MTEDPDAPLTKRSLVACYYITERIRGTRRSAHNELVTVPEMLTPGTHILTNKDAGCLGEEYFALFFKGRSTNQRGDVGFVFSSLYILRYTRLASSIVLSGLDTTTPACLVSGDDSTAHVIMVRNVMF